MSSKTIKITLVKSPIGRLKKHKACLRGLGLRRMGQTVELEDSPRSMAWSEKLAIWSGQRIRKMRLIV